MLAWKNTTLALGASAREDRSRKLQSIFPVFFSEFSVRSVVNIISKIVEGTSS